MTHKQGHDPQGTLMDGISVKIAERYKPPPRINLPVTYSQRLSLNKQILDNTPDYSFILERKVKEQLEALKAARNTLKEERVKITANVNKERKKREEQKKKELKEKKDSGGKFSNKIPSNSLMTAASTPTFSSAGMNSCSSILTPIPLSASGRKSPKPVDKNTFNISDFEADTSSPFDNMELKTLNDMEELAQVLRGDESSHNNSSNAYPIYSPVQSSYVPLPQYDSYHIPHRSSSYSHTIYNGAADYTLYNDSVSNSTSYATSYPYLSQANEEIRDENVQPYSKVPAIMRALEAELDNYHINNHYSNYSSKGTQKSISERIQPNKIVVEDDLENPFNSLPEDLQELAKRISTMGFPLPRVARACKLLGKNNKKVLDHLLAMSELMDLGFTEKEVSNALVQSNHDRDKALDRLVL